MRLDKFLKVSRLIKRRTVANDACDAARITVNGKPIDESAYLKSGVNPSDSPFSVTVTDGNVFVLGDNRSNSRDSRYHLDDGNNGLVPYDDIQGVALFRFWPFTRIGILN